jgi:cell division protein FtsL
MKDLFKWIFIFICIVLIAILLLGTISVYTIKEKSDKINELETIIDQQEQEKEVYMKQLEEK